MVQRGVSPIARCKVSQASREVRLTAEIDAAPASVTE